MNQPSQSNTSGGGGGFAQPPRQEMEYICAGSLPRIVQPGIAWSDKHPKIVALKMR